MVGAMREELACLRFLASRVHAMASMTETTLACGNDPAVNAWPGIDPDVYLDARRPGWRIHEAAGLIRFVRHSGERRGRLRVAPSATEIMEALALAAPGSPAPGRMT
jgi:hypothetical protein